MKAFTGNFTFKVDRKGRISVPAEYRAILSAQADGQDAGILAFPWFDYPAIRGCGLELMERIAANRSPTAAVRNAPIANCRISATHLVQMPLDSRSPLAAATEP